MSYAPVAVRFEPPAPRPFDRDPSLPRLAFRMARSQIEGWPRAVYEADTWRPPVPGAALFVMTPEAVRDVLQGQAGDFSTGALFRRVMRPAWGEGMLTAQGSAWRMQRQSASRAFRPAEMANLTPFFVRAVEAAIQRWTSHPPQRVDVLQEMTRLSFDVILDTILSGAKDFDRRSMAERIDRLFRQTSRVPLVSLLVPDRFHERRPSAHVPERETLLKDIGRMISRRRHGPPNGDLIDLLMQAQDPETGEKLDDALLADNLLGFIIAGHETTSLALTWALFLVATHRPTLQRLRAEVEDVTGNAPVGPEHIARLQFTRQVVSETLRLYPPAFLLTRVAGRDTMVAGHRVRVGQRVNIPVYAIHRRADVFPDPHAFDPDRFAPDRPQPSRHSYLPFGAGPRICLGAAFAMTEAVAVLATLVRAVEFEPPPIEKVWPVAQISLRPKGGMPMVVRRPSPGDPVAEAAVP